jgi:cytochrome c553
MRTNLLHKKLRSNLKVAAIAVSIAISGLTIASAPEAPKKADATAGESLYTNGDASRNITACVGCHGSAGNSGSGAWPKLAGQHAGYLQKQLQEFKSGKRANPVMSGIAAGMEEQEMKNIAAYLAKQTQKGATAKNKETIEMGQSIYRGGIVAKNVPACAACHGPAGAGIPVQYPRVGGQWGEYTESQLIGFRSGARKNPQMTAIAAKMSDLEIKAVSDYISGLR